MSPMPKGPMMQKGPAVAHPWKVLRRLFAYLLKRYKFQCLLVFVLILCGTAAMVMGNLFIKTLIDDYIAPFLTQSSPNFTPLLKQLVRMGLIFLAGALSTLAYNQIMVYVTQGTLRSLRCDLFRHMETLPIRYFDTHPHGDIMSIYTNDIDTLRQMISQSMPQLVSSAATILGVLLSMISLNIPLTCLSLFMVGLMLLVTRQITNRSSRYFVAQQKNLGTVNGYIEEMMEGQKVIKVFCHEKENVDRFNALNDELFHSADNANGFANILMPIMGNMGNLSYVLTSIVGALLAIGGVGGFTLGGLASFLQFNRSFNQPISQISQQINAIIMALAGAQRIFTLLDEEPEEDEGDVTLVNVLLDKNGKLQETQDRTELWAWKSPDGTLTPLRGDVRMKDVTFGYVPEKTVLHNISLYAKPGQKIAFVGATGAGKTTILNLLGGMDKATSGTITVGGKQITGLRGPQLTDYRRTDVGFVFQFYNLMPNLTALENVELARQVCKDALDPKTIMEQVGLGKRMNNFPAQLSGGEQQRVSIARALCKNPALLLCDEPTGALDSKTGVQVLSLLTDVCRTHNATVVIITHNAMIAPLGNRVIRVKNGGIESIETCGHPARVEDIAW